MRSLAVKPKLASGPSDSEAPLRLIEIASFAADVLKESCAANDELASNQLLYNWNRYYDPKIGGYLQPDLISVGDHAKRWMAGLGAPNQLPPDLNPYRYVLNNPLRYIDPTGLDPAGLPSTGSCKMSEWKHCEAVCAPKQVAGCYVSISWKMRGVRDGKPIQSEERTVNCNCKEPPKCGSGCQAVIVGGLIIAGACLAGPLGGVMGGLVGIGAQ